jgi:hypothetical protein
MTTPTGAIKMSDVATELGITGRFKLTDPLVRSLAGIASGPIKLTDLRNKSAFSTRTITSAQASGVYATIRGFSDGIVTDDNALTTGSYGSISNNSYNGRTIRKVVSTSTFQNSLRVYLNGTTTPGWTKVVYNGTEYSMTFSVTTDKSGNTYVLGTATISGVYTSLAAGNTRTIGFI